MKMKKLKLAAVSAVTLLAVSVSMATYPSVPYKTVEGGSLNFSNVTQTFNSGANLSAFDMPCHELAERLNKASVSYQPSASGAPVLTAERETFMFDAYAPVGEGYYLTRAIIMGNKTEASMIRTGADSLRLAIGPCVFTAPIEPPPSAPRP